MLSRLAHMTDKTGLKSRTVHQRYKHYFDRKVRLTPKVTPNYLVFVDWPLPSANKQAKLLSGLPRSNGMAKYDSPYTVICCDSQAVTIRKHGIQNTIYIDHVNVAP